MTSYWSNLLRTWQLTASHTNKTYIIAMPFDIHIYSAPCSLKFISVDKIYNGLSLVCNVAIQRDFVTFCGVCYWVEQIVTFFFYIIIIIRIPSPFKNTQVWNMKFLSYISIKRIPHLRLILDCFDSLINTIYWFKSVLRHTHLLTK